MPRPAAVDGVHFAVRSLKSCSVSDYHGDMERLLRQQRRFLPNCSPSTVINVATYGVGWQRNCSGLTCGLSADALVRQR
jgi:hypothetical protein